MIIMYDLRRRGFLGEADDFVFPKDKERAERNGRALVSLAFVDGDWKKDQFDISYEGTGTVPPVQVRGLALRQEIHERLDGRWPLQFENLDDVLTSLRSWGLVSLDESFRLLLTKKGQRFLDLVGTSLDDPDVLLRWRDPQTGIWRDDAIPAIDRWIHRSFRAVKRRVSSLPAAPKVEIPLRPRKSYENRRLRVIYGGIKRFTRQMLVDPHISKQIADIEARSLTVPFCERRFGIGRDSRCLGYENTPYIFWAGVPVGILSAPEINWRTVGPLADQTAAEEALSQALHDFGSLFDGEWRCTREFLAIKETDEERQRFFDTSDPWDCPVRGLITASDRERKNGRPVVYTLLPTGSRRH